ncbi:hypothetical protein ACGRHY_14540 [Streptomyces sp. HK10]|uniref:hypothetical protein n=1 Tax=Streptomyces sp. HK10 TaxID=3373255 RepID=UPI003749C1DC
MDPTITGAWIALGGAALGGLGGYLAGRAQAKGTVDGVKLQLLGQREDALWQAERDAYARLYSQFNQARIEIGHLIGLYELDRGAARALATAGTGSREEALATLQSTIKECWYQECLLKLSAPSEHARIAAGVRDELSNVMNVLHPWCATRAAGRGEADSLKTELDQRMAAFREALDRFASDIQGWLAKPRMHGSVMPRGRWLGGEVRRQD